MWIATAFSIKFSKVLVFRPEDAARFGKDQLSPACRNHFYSLTNERGFVKFIFDGSYNQPIQRGLISINLAR